jgi:catechol 2,3-dioxygenase-like lactoylglutathione lyase family enzyme
VPLEITSLSPMLKVADLARTIQYYTQTLGFAVENRKVDDIGKPTWCALKWGGATGMFWSAESLDQPPGPPAMTRVLYFNPADVRALWDHLKDRV